MYFGLRVHFSEDVEIRGWSFRVGNALSEIFLKIPTSSVFVKPNIHQLNCHIDRPFFEASITTVSVELQQTY